MTNISKRLLQIRRSAHSLAAIFAAGVFATSYGAAATLSSDLPDLLKVTTTVEVIVQLRQPPTILDITRILAQGGIVLRTFVNLPMVVVRVPVLALPAIALDPLVLYISPDRKLAGKLEFAAPAVGADIALSNGWTGAGIGIAFVDSGVDPEHPDLKGRVVRSENFVANESSTRDAYGHGTHVAAVAAGDAFASTGSNYSVTFRGIAPRANVISLRALDSSGQGSDSAVLAAIDRAIQLKSVYNIRVLNLSLGRGIRESYKLDPLCRAVERAWMAGIIVVAAAGNSGRDNSLGTSGYGTISSPGNSPYAITVGAMNDVGTTTRADDLMASYSSKGPTLVDHVVKPDLVAPGNRVIAGVSSGTSIRSQLPGNVVPVTYYKTNNTGNTSSVYFRLSGTSVAAPVVSGTAALLLQKTPSLTPDQVKARLMRTATKSFPASSISTDPATQTTYQLTYDLFTVGAGYLDIPAALSNPDLSSGSAKSPKATPTSDGRISIVTDAGTVWSDAVVWGSAVVWGTNVIIDDSALVWGNAVVWGSSNNAGFAVVWGSTTSSSNADAFPASTAANGDQ